MSFGCVAAGSSMADGSGTGMPFSVVLPTDATSRRGTELSGDTTLNTLLSLLGGTCCEDDECGGSGGGDSVLTLLKNLNIDCCDIVSECGIFFVSVQSTVLLHLCSVRPRNVLRCVCSRASTMSSIQSYFTLIEAETHV